MTIPVTAFVPCFQRPRHIREALRSVFAQTYSPLQIIVIDNGSADKTFDIVQAEVAAYHGPHQIITHRNPANLGIETYNVMIGLASGSFIVEFHSDDVSDPDRVEELAGAAQRTGAWLVTSNCRVIGDDGALLGLRLGDDAATKLSAEDLTELRWHKTLLGATFGYVREVLTRFEPLNRQRILMGHDSLIAMRAALGGGIHTIRRPLLSFRHHDASQTARFVLGKDGSEARNERFGYDHTMHTLAMLATLDAAPPDLVTDARRADLRRRLSERLEMSAARWVAARNAMHFAGKEIAWRDCLARSGESAGGARAGRLRRWLRRRRRKEGSRRR